MLHVRGPAGGTSLTGTIFEPGDDPPTDAGAPDAAAPYVWICDECYEVDTGGIVQELDGRAINVAFESPVPRGFESRDRAIDVAREHVRTQFARLGLEDPDIAVLEDATDPP